MAIYSPIEERLINLEKNGVSNGNGAGGGDVKIIKTTDWALVNGEYQYTFKHTLNTENLTVEMIDVATKESMQPIYKIIDNANILIKSITNKEIKVVLISFSGGINAKDEVIASRTDKITGKIYDNLGARMDSTSAQLAEIGQQKLNKTDVLSMANMGQDIKQSITGGSVAVIGVNGTISENILEGEVKPKNTSFFDIGYNILDYELDITSKGYQLNNTDGTIYSASGASVSKFMKLPNENVFKFFLKDDYGTLSDAFNRLAFYDKDRNFLSAFSGTDKKSITKPSGTVFIRFSDTNPNGVDFRNRYLGVLDTNVLFIGGYSKFIESEDFKLTNKPYNRFDVSKVKDNFRNSKSPIKYGFSYTDEEMLNTTNGMCVSDYIEVEENEELHIGFVSNGMFKYIGTDQLYLSMYDKEERLMHRTGVADKFRVPKTVRYIRVYFSMVYKPIFMITNELSSVYVPYNEKIIINNKNIALKEENSDWYGKEFDTYGDSITAIGNGTDIYDLEKEVFLQKAQSESWQQYVVEKLKFSKHYGRGIGGQTFKWNNNKWWANADGSYNNRPESGGTQPIGTTEHLGAFCSWDRIKTMINPNIQLHFIIGGTNDFGQNVPIGDTVFHSDNLLDTDWQSDTTYREFVGDFDINTFKGAIASAIMKIQSYSPNSIIVLGTPLSGDSNNPTSNVTSRRTNSLGLTTLDYAKAMKEVAQEFSIPCIDVNGTTGINVLNRKSFIADEVHPYTSKGKKALARAVIGGLKNIIPNIE